MPSNHGSLTTSGEILPLARAAVAEADLIVGLRRRDSVSVQTLYCQYAGLIRRILIQLFGSDRDVDDLVQETMIVVINRVSALRNESSFKSFVVGVAIHLAKNELRRRAARRFVGLEAADDVTLVDQCDETSAEMARHLYRALNKMSFESRTILILKFVQGCELAEIAASCACSVATVKRRLIHAERVISNLVEADPVLRHAVRGSIQRRVRAA